MAYRTSAPDLVDRERDRDRTERWDRDRFSYEKDRDRYSEVRERFEEDDDHVYTRREALPRAPRDRSLPRHRMSGPYDEDDVVIREQRRRVFEEDRGSVRRRPSPPTRYRSPSPVRRPAPSRPTMLRRPSSLDTFDRKAQKIYYEHDREEYGPPARRSDFRAPPYVEIPLPRHKALPPPRFQEQEYYDEIRVSDPDRFGDEGFRDLPAERVRERKVVRTRRRSPSRESRTTRSFRSSSRSSSSSSTETSRTTTTVTTRGGNEYPKKGKTRIPARLISRRALIDLEYPFIEEGNTIIIQKALGQQNIDDLLKLSDDYKKSERELEQARSMPGDIVEERRTEIVQFPARDQHVTFEDIPGGAPVLVTAHRPPSPVEVVQSRTTTAIVRDVSPARTYTTSYTSGTGTSTTDSYSTSSYDTVREVSGNIPVGPIAIIDHRSHSRHGSHHHHSHSRSRSRHARHSSVGRGELVRAERLSTGELVLLEETVERIEEPSKGVRIEKDRRGPPPKLMKAMLATLT